MQEEESPQVLKGEGKETVTFTSTFGPFETDSITFHGTVTIPIDKAAQFDALMSRTFKLDQKEKRPQFRPRIK